MILKFDGAHSGRTAEHHGGRTRHHAGSQTASTRGHPLRGTDRDSRRSRGEQHRPASADRRGQPDAAVLHQDRRQAADPAPGVRADCRQPSPTAGGSVASYQAGVLVARVNNANNKSCVGLGLAAATATTAVFRFRSTSRSITGKTFRLPKASRCRRLTLAGFTPLLSQSRFPSRPRKPRPTCWCWPAVRRRAARSPRARGT